MIRRLQRAAINLMARALRPRGQKPTPAAVELRRIENGVLELEAFYEPKLAVFVSDVMHFIEADNMSFTATSSFDDLQRTVRLLDFTLPAPGAVTALSVRQVHDHCVAIAAHALLIADEIAARPRAEPMKPEPSAADRLLNPAAEETPDV